MRILFAGVPLAGHLFPMLPLADAAEASGHDVAVLTGEGGAALLPGRHVLEAGPSVAQALAETARRTGADGRDPGASAAELFGGVRVDLGADLALQAARTFAPDLVVHELVDRVGPLVAASLGVPRVVHGLSGPIPPDLMAAIDARAQETFTQRGLSPTERLALVDPFPDALLDEVERDVSPDRITIRPWVHRAHGASPTRPVGSSTPGPRPVVLVSLGTSVDEPALLTQLVDAVLRAGADALVTHDRPAGVRGPDEAAAATGPRAHWLGFVPLADLLGGVDAVVSAGGTGTVLAALTEGLPLVVRPFLADQPWNAARLAARGVAVPIDEPADAEDAVRRVLTEPYYRESALAVSQAIAAMPDAVTVWHRLAQLITPVSLV
jgi:UDP:flavonoid glycosyltransferase YjiC (YdhE family)